MTKIQDLLNTILSKLNFLSSDNRISITNLTVALFVAITAFRGLFGGGELIISHFDWKIQVVDYASTLPLMFSLLNYSHKRQQINQTTSTTDVTKGNS